MEDNKIEIQEVKIDFYEVIYGWINYRIEVNNQSWDGQFSIAYDPILDLKYWLEALARGVFQAALFLDEEGNYLKFDVTKVIEEKENWGLRVVASEYELFTLSNPEFQNKVFIKQYVNRKQLVSAFYNGLIEFSKSGKFNSDDWEFRDLKDLLCEKYNLSEYELLNVLLQKSGKQLADYLFEESPKYIKSIPEIEVIKYQSFNIGNDEYSETGKEIKKNLWIVPDEYDNWDINLKKRFITECLKEQQSSYDGTKIKDFHSEIINNYLSKKEPREHHFIDDLKLRLD